MSDKITSGSKQSSHELMPGLTWAGSSIGARQYSLFRAYAFTDEDCVNVVFRGAVVGSPAYAPRISGPLKLPAHDTDLQLALTTFLPSAGSESATFAADGSTDHDQRGVGERQRQRCRRRPRRRRRPPHRPPRRRALPAALRPRPSGPKVDLPDLNFPTTRYYWTVVPVVLTEDATGALEYQTPRSRRTHAQPAFDELRQGERPVPRQLRQRRTSRVSRPAADSSPRSRTSRSSTARRSWRGSRRRRRRSYEVQWSPTLYPWRPAGTKATFSTATVLNLKPGHWYYKVRGLNAGALRIPFMRWSAPVQLTVARPTFRTSSRTDEARKPERIRSGREPRP